MPTGREDGTRPVRERPPCRARDACGGRSTRRNRPVCGNSWRCADLRLHIGATAMPPLARQYNPNPDGEARFWMTRHACREDQEMMSGFLQ